MADGVNATDSMEEPFLGDEREISNTRQKTAEELEEEAEKYMSTQRQKKDLEPKNTLYIELKDGIVVAELYPQIAPRHIQRVKSLVEDGFYDDIVFHRVINGFMAQTGDPTGTGRGGSKMGNLKAEFNNEKHIRGTLSMARASDVNSANSQFFIVTGETFPQLDGQYTIFGKVVEGMQYVDRIKAGDPVNNGMVKEPDKMIAVITGDMLNNKSLSVVKQEIAIINELQNEKIREDPKYVKKSVLHILYTMRNDDITGTSDRTETKQNKEEEQQEREPIDAPIVILDGSGVSQY
ncbi:MAG: peptidylprolyl isomerase [Rickettsiales bacterium]|jgi:peptidylprolyl isomerase|nr:peptidylprolyl isomerase [Rickettsiales bacterium]